MLFIALVFIFFLCVQRIPFSPPRRGIRTFKNFNFFLNEKTINFLLERIIFICVLGRTSNLL